jgi:hypothetical protein
MSLTRIAAGGAALAVTVLGAAGCSTMQSPPMEVDAAYIAYVENAAKLYSTQVIWINPPMRPVRAPAQPAAPAVPAAK